MEFRVLGPLEVVHDGRAVPLAGSRERAVLAILLASPNRVVARDRLVEDLWCGRPPDDATGALRVFVSRLRRALRTADGTDVVVTRPPGYLAQVDPSAVDATRFERLLERARGLAAAGGAPAALGAYDEALALWRGPALADVAGTSTARAEAARLEELRLAAHEERAEAQIAGGRAVEAATDLEVLTQAHPLRERLWGLRMRALYAAGRQADALQAYRDVRRLLADELGLEPGRELARLEAAVLRHAPELEAARPAARHNLPMFLAPFVGRGRELAELAGLLGRVRLLTLTGVGGVGKTRLAVEVAAAARDRFSGGVCVADLVPLREAGQVPAAVAGALGLEVLGDETADALGRRLDALLAGRAALLLLDNCEHLLDPVADLARRLLARCAGLTVLATSRERLGLAGEVVWGVPSLEVPAAGAGFAALRDTDAVRFFCERASAARSDFALTEGASAAVVRVCRRLDGIPLALELAASRVRVLGVEQVADRLDDRFKLLAGYRGGDDRHRTLRAAVSWSYDLLSPAERDALAALSVFPQSFEVDAAEAVVSDGSSDGVDLLCRLVDKSLVVVLPDDGSGPRYRLLETIREYAAERLAEAGAEEAARRRHRDAFVARIESWRGCHFSSERLEGATAEADNLRAALDWSGARGDADAVLRILPALYLTWYWSGDPYGRAWLDRVCTSPEYAGPGLDEHPRRAELLVGRAMNLAARDDVRPAALLKDAVALAERTGDTRGLAIAHQTLGELVLYFGASVDECRAHLEVALDGWRRLGLTDGVGWSRYHLAWNRLAGGDASAARRHLELAEEQSRDDPASGWLRPHAQSALAPLLARAGEADRAFALAAEAIATARPLRSRPVLAMTLIRAGDTAFLAGCRELAAARLVEALELLSEAGMVRWLGEALELAALVLAAAGTPEEAAEALGAARTVRHIPSEALLIIRVIAPELAALPAGLARVLGADGLDGCLTRGQKRATPDAVRRTVGWLRRAAG